MNIELYPYQVNVSMVIKASQDDCYKNWIDVVFKNGGGLGLPLILEYGDRDSHVGLKRQVTGGIIEEILATDQPNSIEYTVISGMMSFKSPFNRST